MIVSVLFQIVITATETAVKRPVSFQVQDTRESILKTPNAIIDLSTIMFRSRLVSTFLEKDSKYKLYFGKVSDSGIQPTVINFILLGQAMDQIQHGRKTKDHEK